MSISSKRVLGNQGEGLVADYLVKQGFVILDKNFSVRGGEVDIIARKKDIIAFVEVKTRLTAYFSTSEVVTPSKQKKIIFAAKCFIARHRYIDTSYRFDVALVQGALQEITYIEHAFFDTSAE